LSAPTRSRPRLSINDVVLMDWERVLLTVPLPDEPEAARRSGKLAGFDDQATEDRVQFDPALFVAAWTRWADPRGGAA
jgi:hypothetical protein